METFERNQRILARYDAGETLKKIGDSYGLTRERVRQIILAHGRAGRFDKKRGAVAVRHAKVVEDLRAGLGVSATAERHALSRVRVWEIAKAKGVKIERERPLEKVIREMQAVARVRHGESIIQAAKRTGVNMETLRQLVKKEGVPVRHGRWRDLSSRGGIVREGRAKGETWASLAKRIGEAEGYRLSATAVYVWARRATPELFETPKVCSEDRRVSA